MSKITLTIDKMICVNCEDFINGLLQHLEGVNESKINLKDSSVDVLLDDKIVNIDFIIGVINKTGIYKAKLL